MFFLDGSGAEIGCVTVIGVCGVHLGIFGTDRVSGIGCVGVQVEIEEFRFSIKIEFSSPPDQR